MAYQVIFKKRFTKSLQKLLTYLQTEWSQKVAAEFIEKVDRRIKLLASQPYVGAPSSKVKDVRGVLVSRHNKMYYKIIGTKVLILNMYDTRMNPKRNPY